MMIDIDCYAFSHKLSVSFLGGFADRGVAWPKTQAEWNTVPSQNVPNGSKWTHRIIECVRNAAFSKTVKRLLPQLTRGSLKFAVYDNLQKIVRATAPRAPCVTSMFC